MQTLNVQIACDPERLFIMLQGTDCIRSTARRRARVVYLLVFVLVFCFAGLNVQAGHFEHSKLYSTWCVVL